ncbi:MAG: fenitrothion hydrolase [bacterium]
MQFPLPIAHALEGKADLPIPEWLFAWAASLVLLVSFVVLTLAWKRARFEDADWRPFKAGLARALVNPVTAGLAGALGAFLLGAIIWSGLFGTEAPDRNFSLTFVFVTCWVGIPVASAFAGDVFRAFNPWRAIARVAASGFRLIAGQAPPPPLRYPERWGRWPAVLGIVGFTWLELVFAQSGFQAIGLTPHTVAIAALAYTGLTFVGMALFGIDEWLDRGEAFSVFFNMFSRLASLEVRDGRLGRRRWLSGAVGWAAVPGSVALVLVSIGTTAFDGAGEGLLQEPIADTFDWLYDSVGVGAIWSLRLANSLFFVLTIAAVSAIFWAGIAGMRTVRTSTGSFSAGELGRLFGHSFIPIALAYLVAHYFSLFVFQEQAQFTYLLSDPLGDGSDYFGTAAAGIDYKLVGATLVWYVQVAALVIGHVIALVLAHDRALTAYGEVRAAARSQYWMLAMMVGFTTLGLFLLSFANQ